MKRYIKASNPSKDVIVLDNQTLRLKFVSKYLNRYDFLDDKGTRYIYDLGGFRQSKFNNALDKELIGKTLIIKAKTKQEIINGVPMPFYYLLSPTLINIEDNGNDEE